MSSGTKCLDLLFEFHVYRAWLNEGVHLRVGQTQWQTGFDCNTYWATLTIAHHWFAKNNPFIKLKVVSCEIPPIGRKTILPLTHG